MPFFDNRSYYFNKLFLSLIGQWPYQSRLQGYVMSTVAFLSPCSVMAMELWGIIGGMSDIDIVMENMALMLLNSLVVVKMINHICNKHKMKLLLDDIKETWETMQVDQEIEILRNYAEQNRVLTLGYALPYYLAWIIFNIIPQVIKGFYEFLPMNKTYTVRFLYRCEHSFDVDNYYNLLVLHGTFTGIFIVTIPPAVDGLFIASIQHVCALFKIVRHNTERIQSSDFIVLQSNVTDDKAYRAIIGCVKLHKRALKFSELLSSAYATSYVFLLGDVIVCLGFCGAEMIIVDNDFDAIVKMIIAMVAQILHIYFLCLTAQRLIDHSVELHEAIYSCGWYTISLRCRKLLKFMMLCTTQPCQIKAGKVYVMSMENFSSILRVSMSYFTMFTSLQ